MDHLRALSNLNRLLGWFSLALGTLGGLTAVALIGGAVLVAMLGDPGRPEDVSMLAELLVLLPPLGVLSLLCFPVGVLHLGLGRSLLQGRGRLLQTVFAVLSLGSPIGTLYAAYAVFVCWVHPETSAVFTAGGRRRLAL